MSDCCLSADLLAWLEDWGADLNRKVDDASQEAWAACQVSVHRPQSKVPSMLRVGTDCSGIEAPIHALQGMGISHKHLWSSESEAAPRQVILANTPPEEVFTDVISSSQGESPPFVQLYITGFSCKPFSTLHHQTKLLEEPEAKVFFAVVDRIHQVRLSCFVLENVMGIKRVAVQVQDILTSSGLYSVIPLEMNPVDLGEPVQRPRIYFLGVRKDVALASAAILTKVCELAWNAVKNKFAVQSPRSSHASHLLRRLLPATHPSVLQHQQLRKERWWEAGGVGVLFRK